jgi:nitrite reductase/ring-hydroxylating ferredoxin subunit
MRHDVCAAAELRPGEMVETSAGAATIVVARGLQGGLYAFSARCLHQGAPLSRGRLLAAVEGGRPGDYRLAHGREVVKCPWHGYEYELGSGKVLFDGRRGLRTFPVYEQDGRVVVEAATREPACRA